MDARTHGASINPRVRCTVADRDGDQWRLSLESMPHRGTLHRSRPRAYQRRWCAGRGGSQSSRPGRARGRDSSSPNRCRSSFGGTIRAGWALHCRPPTGGLFTSRRFRTGTSRSVRWKAPATATSRPTRMTLSSLADVAGQYLDAPLSRSEVVDVLTVVRARNADRPRRIGRCAAAPRASHHGMRQRPAVASAAGRGGCRPHRPLPAGGPRVDGGRDAPGGWLPAGGACRPHARAPRRISVCRGSARPAAGAGLRYPRQQPSCRARGALRTSDGYLAPISPRRRSGT